MATLAISQTSKFSVWSLPEDQSNRTSSKPLYTGTNQGLIVEKVEESKLFNGAQDDDGEEGDAQLNQALTMLGGSFAMYDDTSLIMFCFFAYLLCKLSCALVIQDVLTKLRMSMCV
jgi:hypothetical protein